MVILRMKGNQLEAVCQNKTDQQKWDSLLELDIWSWQNYHYVIILRMKGNRLEADCQIKTDPQKWDSVLKLDIWSR